MDVVTNAANEVVRQSITAAQVATDELVKQANTVAQLAQSKDPIAWLAGEEEGASGGEDGDDDRPPLLVPVPLAALRSWGANWPALTTHAGLRVAPAPVFIAEAPCPSASSTAGIFASDDDVVEDVAQRRYSAIPSLAEGLGAQPCGPRALPFAPDAELNGKVILWEGDICSLEVDGLLTPVAAGYTLGASTVFPKVLEYGRQELRQDIRRLEQCRSGEARLVKAVGLPCHRLLVTIGPKYKDKYQIAAQNTLNSCYRECFQLLVESELRTIAIPCTWYNKGYPPEEQAHVALRTVRKCLEHMRQGVDSVVLAASTAQEAALYERLLPRYFPRTEAEAREWVTDMPESCYSTWGEVAVEERKIRISSHLISSYKDSDDEDDQEDAEPLFSPANDADQAFLHASEDADEKALRRLEGTMIEAETPEEARQACIRYLRRARELHVEPVSSRFVFRAGQDRFARGVVVLLGARMPSLGVRDERTVPLFVKELELLRGERFVLLYVHSDVPALDTSALEVLQEMVAVIGAKYRNSLDQILVLHPGLWFRAAFALGRAVCNEAANVWHDSIYVEGLKDLSTWLGPEQLQQLPEYVRACDAG